MENETLIGCRGKTYVTRKVDLLHQLGYHDVTRGMFKGLSEVQIDNKARQIMSKPPRGYRK